MAASAVEQILAALAAIAATIPGCKQVSRDGVDVLSLMDFPAVVIGVQDDVPSHLLDAFMDRALRVSLTVWVKAQSEISKALEEFKAEARKTMAADPRMGLDDKVYLMEGPSSGPFPLNQDLTEAAEVIEYTIRYRTTITDPYTLIG